MDHLTRNRLRYAASEAVLDWDATEAVRHFGVLEEAREPRSSEVYLE